MKRTICIILIVAFASLFGASTYFIFDHYRQETKQVELYDSLADIVNSAAETEEEPAEPILFTEEKTVLPELAELYQQNSDLAGWIRIEDPIPNQDVKTIIENASSIHRPVSIATRDRIVANGRDNDLEQYYSFANLEITIADDFEEIASREEIYQLMLSCRESDYRDLPDCTSARFCVRHFLFR